MAFQHGFEGENQEIEKTDTMESEDQEVEKQSEGHFADAYHLKPNENYESHGCRYQTDSYGRIIQCEGTLRLDDGKRNNDHQRRAGGEDRLENDQGGHLIAVRFDGSGKIDNLVPMNQELNQGAYKKMENGWAKELKNGNTVDVKIRCKYEGDSTRPKEFIVQSVVTEPDGTSRTEYERFKNKGDG